MTESEALIFAEKFMRCNFEECLKSDIDCDVCENDYEKIGTLDDFLKKTIEALEKQIPKKPTIYTSDNETRDKDRLACCSVCGSNVDWTYEGYWRKGNPKYCSKCGQAIDWSEN